MRVSIGLAVTALCTVANAKAAECLDHYRHLSASGSGSSSSIQISGVKAPRLSEVKAGRVSRDLAGNPLTPSLKARRGTIRPSVEGYERSDGDFREIVVKFSDDSLARAVSGRLLLPDAARSSSLEATMSGFADLSFGPAVDGGDDWLTALRFCAADNTGRDFADLTSYFVAKVPASRRKSVPGLVRALLQHPDVETAWLRGPTGSTALDLPPTTPQMESGQRHWDTAPSGINLRNSWGIAGVKGAGLRYVDVEADMPVLDHEDFPTVGGNAGANLHSTAVVGVLSAAHNGFGHHGGVPDAGARVETNLASLLNQMSGNLSRGDSMLIELAWRTDPKALCTNGLQPGIPLERDDAIFDQLQQLSANGVVVYEAAGNEPFNLDGCLSDELSRSARDSGAILVAAGAVASSPPVLCGTPTATNSPASYTAYGSRIDAYGWGGCVHTTGWNNDLFYDGANPSDLRQYYSREFDGTSAATAVVAAAGMAIQGWQKARTGRTYNPIAIRALLKQHGTPASGPFFIGKQPDVGAMLTWLQADNDGDGYANGDELSMGQDLIDHYYDKILGRAPDPGGKLYWHAQVEHLRSFEVDPREAYRALSKMFFFSQEYLQRNRSDSQFVDDLYQTFFQRPADTGGLSYWQGQLSSGLNRESAVAAFMFSAEFTTFMNLALTATPQREELSIIVGGYRGALGLLPVDAGIINWRAQLRAAICEGSGTRWASTNTVASNLMIALFFDGAYNHGRTHSQYVADVYDAVLNRGTDLGGLQFWVNQLNGGQTRQWFLNQLLAGAEWQQRITNTISQTPQCVP